MSLAPGNRVGSYEVTGPIGKGGMGEVYRARDTKLDRDVAIKVLPDEFANDDERLARFEREAKLLAALNHPSIASIYGFEEADGVKALVLELVEGPTLAERIQLGRIPVDEAIAIAKQIAEALEAGHEAGVIHRDLKPANIKLKEDGTVKVLDYGLAKALEGDAPSGADSELSQSPTLTRQGTQVGVILGTAAYMSPEQAKGKRVDRRTDVWAFGAVLYEMLTGKRAFGGDDVSETLAAVIRAEPDYDELPADTPEPVRRTLQVCLTKDVNERVHAVADARLALGGAFGTTANRERTAPAGWRPSLVLGLLLAGVASVAVWRMTRPAESPRPVTRFSFSLPPGDTLTGTAGSRALAVSADGTRFVYRANQQLYLRVFDQSAATPIRGSSEAPASVFLSPDGAWVGYYANGELKKLSVQGGSAVKICDATIPYGAHWGADNDIVFSQRGVGIVRVSADGGTPETLVPLPEDHEVAQGPQILPGGDAVLFSVGDVRYGWNGAQIVVESLDTGARKVLVERGQSARYLPTGHLAYLMDATMLAATFDVERLAVTGGAIPVVEGVTASFVTGDAHLGISDTGSLVYRPVSTSARTLVWVDREGREEVIPAEPRGYFQPRISPDGRRVAVDVWEPVSDLWIWDFGRETLTQLTFSPEQDHSQVWTPDGSRVVFSSGREGPLAPYSKAADGTGTAERLHEGERALFVNALTPDGKELVYSTSWREGGADLGSLSLDGSSEPLLQSSLKGWRADLSPDGRWIAFQTDGSGRPEIHVRPFPNVEDGHWPITRGGGTSVRWSRDGTELFYMAPGGKLMAVDVETEPSFVVGSPKMITSGYHYYSAARNYDVSTDGKRFLMIKDSEANAGYGKFEVVLNWFTELERLVPTE